MNVSSTVDVFVFYPTITMLDDGLLLKRKTNAKISSQTWFYRTRFQSVGGALRGKGETKEIERGDKTHPHFGPRGSTVSRGKRGDEYPPLTSTSDDRLQYRTDSTYNMRAWVLNRVGSAGDFIHRQSSPKSFR